VIRAELTLKLESIAGIYIHWLAGPYPLVSIRAPHPVTVSVVTAMVVVVTPVSNRVRHACRCDRHGLQYSLLLLAWILQVKLSTK